MNFQSFTIVSKITGTKYQKSTWISNSLLMQNNSKTHRAMYHSVHIETFLKLDKTENLF